MSRQHAYIKLNANYFYVDILRFPANVCSPQLHLETYLNTKIKRNCSDPLLEPVDNFYTYTVAAPN